MIRESGKIGAAAAFETHNSTQEIYEAATLPSLPYGELLPSEQPRLSFAERVPVGVVGVISPFNFPQILAARSVAPALALGNAVVLKPDPRTSVCGGVVLARVFEEAGLPEGLLHVLPGGPVAGAALITDPLVRIISFTGSTAVAGASASWPPATSSGCTWSSAATPRSSSWTTSISPPPPRPAPGGRSCTRGRSA